MLLRHLAATLLPLASTAVGVVAVGVAVQLPSAPPQHVVVPVVATPVSPETPVVARVVHIAKPKPARRLLPQLTRTVRSRPVVVAETPAPRPVPPSVPTTQAPEVSMPVSNMKPPPDEEAAAPLTPPVSEPQPEPQPSTGPAPQTEPALQTTPVSAPVTTTPVLTTTATTAVLMAATKAAKTKKPKRPKPEKPDRKTPRDERPAPVVLVAAPTTTTPVLSPEDESGRKDRGKHDDKHQGRGGKKGRGQDGPPPSPPGPPVVTIPEPVPPAEDEACNDATQPGEDDGPGDDGKENGHGGKDHDDPGPGDDGKKHDKGGGKHGP